MTYTIVQTEKDYRVLKERVVLLDGMQLRFLHDLHQDLVPDLDMVSMYFESLHKFNQLQTLELVTVHPQRTPSPGEKDFIVHSGVLYYGIRASVFKPEITEEGIRILKEVSEDDLFSQCMADMDRKMAEALVLHRGETQ